MANVSPEISAELQSEQRSESTGAGRQSSVLTSHDNGIRPVETDPDMEAESVSGLIRSRSRPGCSQGT